VARRGRERHRRPSRMCLPMTWMMGPLRWSCQRLSSQKRTSGFGPVYLLHQPHVMWCTEYNCEI
jgi:hypothetical protein